MTRRPPGGSGLTNKALFELIIFRAVHAWNRWLRDVILWVHQKGHPPAHSVLRALPLGHGLHRRGHAKKVGDADLTWLALIDVIVDSQDMYS